MKPKKLRCADGSILYIAKACRDYNVISAQLCACGMQLQAEHCESGNRYRVFSAGPRTVTLTYTEYGQTVRLFVESGHAVLVTETADMASTARRSGCMK